MKLTNAVAVEMENLISLAVVHLSTIEVGPSTAPTRLYWQAPIQRARIALDEAKASEQSK